MRTTLFVLVFAVGCGGAGGAGGAGTTGKPLHAFPSRAALAELAARPNAAEPLATDLAASESWTLELAAAQSEHPGHPLLARVTPKATPSAGLDCAARELARLMVAHDKRPGMSVRRFVSARCGALLLMPAFQSWATEAAADETDSAIFARLLPQLTEPIDAGATQAGIGLARDGNKILVVVAYGTPEVEVEPFQQVVGDSGALYIRGRVLFDVEGLEAYVNTGAYGVTPCELDPSRAPPAFALTCRLAPGEDAAWVQLLALPRDRVIGHEVLGIVALRRGDAAATYSPLRIAEPRPVADAASFRAAVIEILNAIRSRLGLAKLVAAQKQSALASSVSTAFFTAALGEGADAQKTLDAISLGLLAGWDVTGGLIRNGDLTASLIVDSLDAERWLADALERPIGRAVLLDGDARVLALGSTLQPQPTVLAAIALTYTFFEREPTPGARAAQVLERLARVRQARGLGSTTLVRDTPTMAEQLASIQRGETTPGQALDSVMGVVSELLGGAAVQGFVWETQDLDLIEFPRELLQPGDLTLGAGVTYYRAPGGAWGQYTVLFVVMNPAREV